MSDTEWMILIAQLRASPEVAMEVLGMDSTHLSFDEEIEERIRRRKSALSDIHYRAQQDKIMSQGDSTEYMRRYIKNMSANYYGSGKTMEWAKKFVGQELIDEYTRMSVALGDPSKTKLYHLHAGSSKGSPRVLHRAMLAPSAKESGPSADANLRPPVKRKYLQPPMREPNFKKVAIEPLVEDGVVGAKPDSSSRGSDAESFFDDLLVCRDIVDKWAPSATMQRFSLMSNDEFVATSSVGRKSNAIFASPATEVRLPSVISRMPYSHYPGYGNTSSVGLYYTGSAFIIINPSHYPLVKNEREWYLANASVTPTIENVFFLRGLYRPATGNQASEHNHPTHVRGCCLR
ncbi:hypothetical protein Tco_0877069 [Tanacetum coccineum]|uniref:Uncharacterized protein n=1 Tax=Tanacetum coccineum TaxID=301880 RepID=A0ABQ5BXI1_9ASTR